MTATCPESDMTVDRSNDQHRVSEGEQPILFLHGNLIGFHHKIIPGKGRDEHEERTLGHVEVRKQAFRDVELVRRINEFVRPANIRLQRICSRKTRFNSAHYRCAHGSYRMVGRVQRHIGSRGHFWGDVIELRVHAVFGQVFHLYRTKCTQTHMKGNR